MVIALKSIWSAISSRIKPIYITPAMVECIQLSLCSPIYNTDRAKIYLSDNGYNKYREDFLSRTLFIMDLYWIDKVKLFIIPVRKPFNVKFPFLTGFKSGIGGYNLLGQFVVVSQYSFLKNEYFPYLEHELLHAFGLLKFDHSNWDTYKSVAKYR